MCIIIAVDPNHALSHTEFRNALLSAVKRNPDGIGIAYIEGDKVETKKALKGYQEIIDLACDRFMTDTNPFMVHMRYNTVGKNTDENCHPFVISDTLAMMHNKTLDLQPPNKAWSDSRTLAELLKLMVAGDPDFYFSTLFDSFMNDQKRGGNRVAFLEAESKSLFIYNQELGVTVKGVWFSNRYAWEPTTVGLVAPAPVKPYKGYSKADYSYDHYGYVPAAKGPAGAYPALPASTAKADAATTTATVAPLLGWSDDIPSPSDDSPLNGLGYSDEDLKLVEDYRRSGQCWTAFTEDELDRIDEYLQEEYELGLRYPGFIWKNGRYVGNDGGFEWDDECGG
jgi:hypothetical protein